MAYVDPRLRGKPAPSVSIEQMEKGHVARLAAMKGSELAFLDQRVPGYQREIINIIGMGVVENLDDPDLKPKIAAPAHGFAVTYVRHTPKGHGAAFERSKVDVVRIRKPVRDHPDRSGLACARHVHDLIVGYRVRQIHPARRIPSDIGVAVDARLPTGHVGGFEDLTLDA